jgi:2-hydroxy-4-carboxymuconate semialdehyde hemiacetal dehydrogenase
MDGSGARVGWHPVTIRVGILGGGAVGSIHAAQLALQREVELAAVYSTELESARSFAARYGVQAAVASVDEAIGASAVVIICSPSPCHFEQARASLLAGRHTLVELPPCGDVREAAQLGAIAREQGVVLGCAHTSRYLTPYVRIDAALQSGLLGKIEEITYVRYPQLRPRAWTDDALWHHAAHVIDLAMKWCGSVEPLACSVFPPATPPQAVSLVAALPSGKSLTAAVSYGARLPVSRMVVVGSKHTVETDGFSYLRSDFEMQFAGDEREVYERAIAQQDHQFLEACRGRNGYIPWAETEALIGKMQQFRALSAGDQVSQD